MSEEKESLYDFKNMFTKVSGWVSHWTKRQLEGWSNERQLPVSRLVMFAIQEELKKPIPFDIKYDVPSHEEMRSEEFQYVEEASKILRAMTDVPGIGIDQLIELKNDIGIPDETVFLLALRECIDKEFLEKFKPRKSQFTKLEFPPDYFHLCLEGENRKEKAKKMREAKNYARFKRLEKKFKEK